MAEEQKVPSPDDVERTVFGETLSSTPEDVANKKLKEALIPTVDSLVHLALYGEQASVRLSAGKYLIDRVLGRDPKAPEKDEALKRLMKELQADD